MENHRFHREGSQDLTSKMVYIDQSCQAQTRPTFWCYRQTLQAGHCREQLEDSTDRHDKCDIQTKHSAASCRTSCTMRVTSQNISCWLTMPSKLTKLNANAPP